MTIIVSGTEELVAKFQALSEGMQGEALSNAALAGATVIVNAAKEKAPKRDNHLGPSIHSEVSSVSASSANSGHWNGYCLCGDPRIRRDDHRESWKVSGDSDGRL